MTREIKNIDIDLVQEIVRRGAQNTVVKTKKEIEELEQKIASGKTHHETHPDLPLDVSIKYSKEDLSFFSLLQTFEVPDILQALLAYDKEKLEKLIEDGSPIHESFDLYNGRKSGYHLLFDRAGLNDNEKEIIKEVFKYATYTPLSFAIIYHDLPLLKTLIEGDVLDMEVNTDKDIKADEDKDMSPTTSVLCGTARHAFESGFIYLIEDAGLDIAQDNETQIKLLTAAVDANSLSLVKYLIEKTELKVPQEKETQVSLLIDTVNSFRALESSSLPLVKYLIEEVGLDPYAMGEQNRNWVSCVIGGGHGSLLNDKGQADFYKEGTEILKYVMTLNIDLHRNVARVSTPVQCAPQVDEDGKKMGIESISNLFEQRVETSNRNKTTHLGEAIHHALSNVYIACDDDSPTEEELEIEEIVAQDALSRLAILIEHGADPHRTDINGNAPYEIIDEIEKKDMFAYKYTDFNRIKSAIDLAYTKYVHEHGAHETQENNRVYISPDEQGLKH